MKRYRGVFVFLFVFMVGILSANFGFVSGQFGGGGQQDGPGFSCLQSNCAGNQDGCTEAGPTCITSAGEEGVCVEFDYPDTSPTWGCCDSIFVCEAPGSICTQGPGSYDDPNLICVMSPVGGACPFWECELPPGSVCGDENIDLGEQCDDGCLEDVPILCETEDNGDGCDYNCQIEECGNGILQNWVYPSVHVADPSVNLFVAGPEECDDGNNIDGDGCSASCTVELGSTQYQCDPSQRILRLSSESNAHGEVWDQSNYAIEICYDEIFGSPYFPGTGDNPDPHACSPDNDGDGNPDNLILRLSDVTNAQAEDPDQDNYNVDVCYDNLVCELMTSCAPGQFEVVSLSASSNAQLGIAGTYGNAICCGFAPLTGDYINNEWRNLLDVEIDESYVGKTVKLVAQTGFFGVEVDLAIMEKDDVFDDSITSFNNVMTDPVTGLAEVFWPITQADMDAADDSPCFINCEYEDGHAEFYFTAEVSDGSQGVSAPSEELRVFNFAGPNDVPIANIVAPVHQGIYFEGVGVTFEGICEDSDDLPADIQVEWTILEEPGFTSDQLMFDHTFTGPGQKTITLKCTDDEGATGEDQIAVLVVASPFLLTFIDYPQHMEFVPTSSNGLLIVDYSAEDSYVVDVNIDPVLCTGTVECLAGNCPSSTENSPGTCSPFPVSNTPHPNGHNDLSFAWDFNDGITDSAAGAVSGSHLYGQDDGSSAGQKTIDLTTGYPASSPSLEQSTQRTFTIGQCIDGGSTFVEIDSQTGQATEHDTTDSVFCAGADGLAGSPDDCCPGFELCSNEPGNEGCYLPQNIIIGCGQEQDQGSCEASTAWQTDPLGNDSPECGTWTEIQGVDYFVACSCDWLPEESGTDVCQLVRDYLNDDGDELWSCAYDYDQTECVASFMDISVFATFDAGTTGLTAEAAQCESGAETVPCGQLSFELSFFDYRQFAAAVIIILVIYVLLHLKRREE